MKWVNGYRIRLMLFVSVAAIVLGIDSAKADFFFGEPTNLGPTVNTSSDDVVNCFSADGLEMYFDSKRSGGYGGWDIWVTRRETIDDDWGTPTNLGSTVNCPQGDTLACISFDGLEFGLAAHPELVADSGGECNRPGSRIHAVVAIFEPAEGKGL